ncbi:rhomboid family intramembrane serine protease [Aquimarina brevivitae]|uniref:Membrane associated rhomboid family serine protease n=1 Tax=Aquimarina brevivitae TaxID=323412 RepID=A0A4Q7P1R3_9FLAO|nr:rhomboid family intramembrane serine protease [Aquimarina brevivitae]RZS93268.1 membrane associated rhomboid family serine protease [Aquimarina brevivitae]
MGRITETVKVLLIINVIFFVGSLTLGDKAIEMFGLWFPKNENFAFWQVITHMFMHGGLMHLIFNMYALWAFGSPVEQILGKNKFIFLYFSCGLGAMGLHLLYNYYQFTSGFNTLIDLGVNPNDIYDLIKQGYRVNAEAFDIAYRATIESFNSSFSDPAVGASGAIYGILVAFGISFPESSLMLIFFPVPIKAKYFIPGLIGLDLIFGLTGNSFLGQNIAHFAHIGGALIGFITMWYWKKNSFNQNRWY